MKSILPFRDELLAELAAFIEESRQKTAAKVNSALVVLFWKIGKRINENILENKRAEYGTQIIVTVSRELTAGYGRNFEEKNLRRMLQFASQFPDIEIVVTLSRQHSY